MRTENISLEVDIFQTCKSFASLAVYRDSDFYDFQFGSFHSESLSRFKVKFNVNHDWIASKWRIQLPSKFFEGKLLNN